MTNDNSSHLMRDAVADAKQEQSMLEKGINPKIAKAVILAQHMQKLAEIKKQESST